MGYRSQPSVSISVSKRSLKNKILDSMKDSSFNTQTLSGETSQSVPLPKMKLLDRSKIMDFMLFPQNSKKMVIVPSNKGGTGFLNHCYDETFLTGIITEKEFNSIIVICSKIAAKTYSNKQIVDR